jgi:CHAT domain-containing protein
MRTLSLCLIALVLGAASGLAQNSVTMAAELRDKGARAFARGAFSDAAEAWQQAAAAFEREGNPREYAATLVQLAHALQSIGESRRAVAVLETALSVAERDGDRRNVAPVLGALGSACLVIGAAERAQTYLGEALGVARAAGDGAVAASVLNTMGNARMRDNKITEALAAYTESAELAERSGRPVLASNALLNAARTQRQAGDTAAARVLLDRADRRLRMLPASHDKAFGLVGAGILYRDLRASQSAEVAERLTLQAASAFREAATVAAVIADARTLSYAWGSLAGLYEEERRWDEALDLTRRAVFAAQQSGAPEALYRWQWQSARLLQRLSNGADSLAAYRRAVQTLQSIRQEVSADAGPAGFRDSVGPLYLQFVDALLRHEAGITDRTQQIALLGEARDTVELLKAAELRDYYRDQCVDAVQARTTSVDVVSPAAAVIYPILLDDRLELLASLPDGLSRITVPVPRHVVTAEVRALRGFLEKRTTREYLPHAQRLYDWLVRPVAGKLAASKIDTLVFVPDGPLRTIPMSALHDGERFLIARYAVATTPGLRLTDPRPLRRENLKVLAAGVTQPRQDFPELRHVRGEIDTIQKLYGGTVLVDSAFSVGALSEQLRRDRVGILHIASHGQFASDVDKTFLLAWDDRLTMNRLDEFVGLLRFRDEPLELLMLSACETAAGDDRAALGLAGIAIKAGARSAVATLWFINDQASAELVSEFYRQLRDPSVSRAAALQRAQLAMLARPQYAHPALWSPFLLINNWL